MLNARSETPRLATFEELRLPRRSLEVCSLSITHDTSVSAIVSARHSTGSFNTPLISPLGTLVTSFIHKDRPYVVRFAEHGKELTVVPAEHEHGNVDNSERLFVSAVPSDLGHMMLTPFTGTGLPRMLTRIAVEHALASTGYATAHVRLAHIKNTLVQCGLQPIFKVPIPIAERLAAEANERARRAHGFQFDYEGAKLLEDKVIMSRSMSKQEREQYKHWNLFTTVRLIDFSEGKYWERKLPRP